MTRHLWRVEPPEPIVLVLSMQRITAALALRMIPRLIDDDATKPFLRDPIAVCCEFRFAGARGVRVSLLIEGAADAET